MARTRALSAPRTIVVQRPRKRMRHKIKFTLPIAIVAGFIPLGSDVATQLFSMNGGSPGQVGKILMYDLTGWNYNNHSWDWKGLKQGMLPIAIGFAFHKIANMFGVNRALARAGIPILRI